jgi:hypothetical protein
MRLKKTRFSVIHVLFIAGMAAPLCGQSVHYPLRFKEELAVVRTILIAPIRFDCHHFTSGGTHEYDDSLSVLVRRRMAATIQQQLAGRGYHALVRVDDDGAALDWRRLRRFFSVINNEIAANVYGPLKFPQAAATFSYSLPPLHDTLLSSEFDALLLFDGFNERSTPHREKRAKSMRTAATTVAIASSILGAPVYLPTLREDRTFASCALVNRSGKIIWYHRLLENGPFDITDAAMTDSFIGSLMGRFDKREVSR